ncbi:MAG: DUF4157 domain-containing protein [Desulfobacterales bacterium]|nr:MAG: DUF4157 domain-containing protein [Desulfobacterales bacterium]
MSNQINPLVRRQTEEKEELLQTKPVTDRTPEVTPCVAAEIALMQGSGQPLPSSERTFFEPRFGHDFSEVRIHADTRAANAAQALHSRAFTVGRDIVFGARQYQPEKTSGRQLLAHELTHVMQQDRRRHQKQTFAEGRSLAKQSDNPLRLTNVPPLVPPYLQRLKISTLSKSKGRCGARRVKWHFTLDRRAPADGFIVQEIDAMDFAHDGAGTVIRENNAHYWEAWKVKAGYRRAELASKMHYTDMSERKNTPGSRGADTSSGNVRFYLEEDPAHPARPPSGPYTGPLDLNWSIGGHPASGDLHSTRPPHPHSGASHRKKAPSTV